MAGVGDVRVRGRPVVCFLLTRLFMIVPKFGAQWLSTFPGMHEGSTKSSPDFLNSAVSKSRLFSVQSSNGIIRR